MPSEEIVSHYRSQALQHGTKAISTMPDEVVKDKEEQAILAFLARFAHAQDYHRLLEVGCGNGRLLSIIRARFRSAFTLTGLDLTPEMMAIARELNPDANLAVGDVLETGFDNCTFDVLIAERVFINLLDEERQVLAYREMARVLRPGGVAVLIEGFKSGLENLNRARADFLLEPIPEPAMNNWYTDARWQRFLGEGFVEFAPDEKAGLAPVNFLSTHYFMTRFFHEVIRPARGKLRNTEFARFFVEALPPVGNYSPLQIHYLRRA